MFLALTSWGSFFSFTLLLTVGSWEQERNCKGLFSVRQTKERTAVSESDLTAFWGVLIDLIIEHLVLIIKPVDNQTDS